MLKDRLRRPQRLPRDSWNLHVNELRTHPDPVVRRQLFLGLNHFDSSPVYLPLDSLREHAHITGGTGTGKTSQTVLPLVQQLIRIPKTDPDAGPVVIIDLKAERYLFHAVRKEAEDCGRTFRFFTNLPGHTTFAFNPLLDLRGLGLSTVQTGETLRAALNLEHGTGYGPGYFSAVTRSFLANVLEHAQTPLSLADLHHEAAHPSWTRPGEKKAQDDALELTLALKLLGSRPELNINPKDYLTDRPPQYPLEVLMERIDMARALRDCEVIYFFLKSRAEEALVRSIASLAVECLYSACVRQHYDTKGRQRLGFRDPITGKVQPPDGTHTAWVFLDEFQVTAGRNFAMFLQQARSEGMSLILANQSREELPADLRNTVDHNVGVRQFWNFNTPDALRFMQTLSGKTEKIHSQEDEPTEFERLFPKLVDRFETNELLRIGASATHSIVIQRANRDFSNYDGFPNIVESTWTLDDDTKRTYEHLTPWPEDVPGLLEIPRPTMPPSYDERSMGKDRLDTVRDHLDRYKDADGEIDVARGMDDVFGSIELTGDPAHPFRKKPSPGR